MPTISIVVPIYGTEKYLARCLRSLIGQTFEDFEIICVDDCSPDHSADIVSELAEEDSRVRLIRHERNLGLGGARNTGIVAARAPYIASVDSDDYVESNMLEKLWNATDNGTADVVVCNMALVREDGTPISHLRPQNTQVRNDNNEINIFFLTTPSVCNKLIRTSLFRDHEISFPQGHLYEDLATTPRYLRYAKDIRLIPDLLYCYVVRNGSITQSTSARHIIDHFPSYESLKDFLEREGLLTRYSDDFESYVGSTLHYHSKNVMNSTMSHSEKLQYIRYMLALKLAFLQFHEKLKELDAATLQRLLREARSWEDVENLSALVDSDA